jgi:sensor histidine kinase YesM
MKADDLKKRIIGYIDNAEPELLNKLSDVIENYQKTKAVAYTLEGKLLTKGEYEQELKIAKDEIKKGKFTSQEDLEKEAETW